MSGSTRPRRGMEASGTSGMKAAANGVLNCSILDGWWVEGYAPDLGWAIGRGETYSDGNYQDQRRKPGPLRPPGKADRSAVLQADGRQHPARMDRPDEKLHAQARSGLQHQPHGARLRREVLRSRRRSRPQSSRPTTSSAPSALAKAKDMLRQRWGGIKIVGVHTSGNGHFHVGESCRSKPWSICRTSIPTKSRCNSTPARSPPPARSARRRFCGWTHSKQIAADAARVQRQDRLPHQRPAGIRGPRPAGQCGSGDAV